MKKNPYYGMFVLIAVLFITNGCSTKTPPAEKPFAEITQSAGEKVSIPLPDPIPPDEYRDLPRGEQEYFEGAGMGILPHRDNFLKPFRVMETMGLAEGQVIADIGCGSGYFTYRFSEVVGPEGRVYCVDINPVALKYIQMIDKREKKKGNKGYDNLKFINNAPSDIGVPEKTLDFAFICETHIYVHTFDYTGDSLDKPVKDRDKAYGIILKGTDNFTKSIKKALKDKGKLVIIERYKSENPQASLDKEDCIKILENQGFRLTKDHDICIGHYMLEFEKE